MNCPECDVKGYSRKTKTPEWRCRKCGHEWDVPQTNCSVALANFEVTDRLSTIPPIVEEFLYSIGKNEGDIQDITLEFAFENLQHMDFPCFHKKYVIRLHSTDRSQIFFIVGPNTCSVREKMRNRECYQIFMGLGLLQVGVMMKKSHIASSF